MTSGFPAPPPGPPPPGSPPPEPAQPGPPMAPGRPVTVVIASALLLVVTVCSLAYLGSRIASHGAVRRLYEEAFAGTDLDGYINGLMVLNYVDAGIYVLFGLVLGILTIFVLAGRNGARIATWIVGGLGGCCGAFSLFGMAFGAAAGYLGSDLDQAEVEEIERILAEETPAWYEPVTVGSSLVGVLALVVALILLAMPVSNAFFRKPPDPAFAPPPYGPPPYGPPPYGPPPYGPPPYGPQPPYLAPGYAPPGYPPPGYPPQPPAHPPQPPPLAYPPPPSPYQPPPSPYQPPQPPPSPPSPPAPPAPPGSQETPGS